MRGLWSIYVSLILALPLTAGGEEAPSFAAAFEAYVPGEALSAKGTQNGAWRTEAMTSATNVVSGGRTGMALTGIATFAAGQVPTGTVERIDIAMRVEAWRRNRIAQDGGRGGFMQSLVGESTARGFLVWGGGRWQETTADGVEPEEGTWLDVRMEFKKIGDFEIVGYLVRMPGGEYVRCRTADGRSWFSAGKGGARREVSFIGVGGFSDFAGRGAVESPGTIWNWVGGAVGDWADATKWATNGVAGAGMPPVGSFALITNKVALTHGAEEAQVSSLLVADGTTFVAGTVRTAVDLKTNRPRAGKALTPTVEPFFGVTPDYRFTWRRGSWAKAWEKAPVGREASFTPAARDFESWFRLVVSNDVEQIFSKDFFFSSLPVCYLTTADGAAPSARKEEHAGTLRAQGNDEFKLQYDGGMVIKMRGNSSTSFPKKPYKITLAEKTNMFDLGAKKNKHWVLLCNYNDMTQLRNKLAYDFANAIGSLGMKSTWVDCVFNGEFVGCYQFCEHVRVAAGRVDIYDWEDEAAAYGATETDFSAIDAALAADPGAVDITGGYLFEFDLMNDEVSKFTTTSGKLSLLTMLHKPEYLYTSSRMMGWCRSYLQNYWDACTSPVHQSPAGHHWSYYADVDSMVAYWLVNELHANLDAYQKSRYGYIDRGGKLMFGPVWDFDYASSSVAVPTAQEPDTWMCSNADWSKSANSWNTSSWQNFAKSSFHKEWASDPFFCMKACEKYWQIRPIFVEQIRDGGTIDQSSARLAVPLKANDAKWPRSRNQAGDTAIYKNYLQRRLLWLDAQFKDVATLLASLRSVDQTNPYVPADVLLRPAVDGPARVVSARLQGATRVEVYVNGLRLGSYPVANGTLGGVKVSRTNLDPIPHCQNCITFASYNSSGTLIARNYALIATPPDPTTVILLR